MTEEYTPISEYGIIGNLETTALISKTGSIDWLCLPYVYSSSVFAAILDKQIGGFFSITPEGNFDSHQEYLEDTNILRTTFDSFSGNATVTDYMPVFSPPLLSLQGHPERRTRHPEETRRIAGKEVEAKNRTIVRRLKATNGKITFKVKFSPKFNYAKNTPELTVNKSSIEAKLSDEILTLGFNRNVDFEIREGIATAVFELEQDDEFTFILKYNHDEWIDLDEAFSSTIEYWRNWSEITEKTCIGFPQDRMNLVKRSALLLKLLTFKPTGAIAAAPTTSLPEDIGGERNWDYRYSWIRDSAFTIEALFKIGHELEAKKYFEWITKVSTNLKDISELQIMYGLDGGKDLAESHLDHLEGYQKSRPVRIGNSAYKQAQLDIYGELMNAFYTIEKFDQDQCSLYWPFLKRIANYVCQNWQNEDFGIWEVRQIKNDYIFSKLMCWVALDRALKISEKCGEPDNVGDWINSKKKIEEYIQVQGFDEELNSFVSHPGSKELDAANLLMFEVDFLPINDSRMQGTLEKIGENLLEKNWIYRYSSKDGLKGNEGAFMLTTFWYIRALANSGKIDEAEQLLDNVIEYINPLGLLAEEIDPESREYLGNYPQGYSHIGLINTIYELEMLKQR